MAEISSTEGFAERVAHPGPNATMGGFPNGFVVLTKVCSQIFLATQWLWPFLDILYTE